MSEVCTPPAAENCLTRSYPAQQKGGTLIVEEVLTLDEHERWLRTGQYLRQFDTCPRCGRRSHGHGLRVRVLVEGAGSERISSSTEIQRMRCTAERCRAIWQLMPGFMSRFLWRRWSTAERAALDEPQPVPVVPRRTERRWRSRLISAASALSALFAMSGESRLGTIVAAVGHDATRAELVAAHSAVFEPAKGECLAATAALVHRLAPGMRLM